MNNEIKKGLSSQFNEEYGEEGHYEDLHFKKSNRKDSHDRRDKKKIKKFSKYDY